MLYDCFQALVRFDVVVRGFMVFFLRCCMASVLCLSLLAMNFGVASEFESRPFLLKDDLTPSLRSMDEYFHFHNSVETNFVNVNQEIFWQFKYRPMFYFPKVLIGFGLDLPLSFVPNHGIKRAEYVGSYAWRSRLGFFGYGDKFSVVQIRIAPIYDFHLNDGLVVFHYSNMVHRPEIESLGLKLKAEGAGFSFKGLVSDFFTSSVFAMDLDWNVGETFLFSSEYLRNFVVGVTAAFDPKPSVRYIVRQENTLVKRKKNNVNIANIAKRSIVKILGNRNAKEDADGIIATRTSMLLIQGVAGSIHAGANMAMGRLRRKFGKGVGFGLFGILGPKSWGFHYRTNALYMLNSLFIPGYFNGLHEQLRGYFESDMHVNGWGLLLSFEQRLFKDALLWKVAFQKTFADEKGMLDNHLFFSLRLFNVFGRLDVWVRMDRLNFIGDESLFSSQNKSSTLSTQVLYRFNQFLSMSLSYAESLINFVADFQQGSRVRTFVVSVEADF